MLAELGERLVEVVHGEHDAEVAEGVYRGAPVIGDHRRREKAREFDPAVAVRGTHHGDLDALVPQSSSGPNCRNSRVDPSISVNRNVTVPLGRSWRSNASCTAAQNDQAYPVDQDAPHLGE